jgi:hypothetical protein
VLLEHLEHLFHMMQVVEPWSAKHQHIIKENKDKFSYKWLEYKIHGSLKCRGCIGEAKWYDEELKVTPMCLECGLVDVIGVHAHMVVDASSEPDTKMICLLEVCRGE